MNPDLSSIEKLNLMNQELFLMIDNTVSVDLLSQLFATQLITNGERHMMSPNRTYYKLLRQVISEGKQNGTFREEFSVNDIAKAYAMFERGLVHFRRQLLPVPVFAECPAAVSQKLLHLRFRFPSITDTSSYTVECGLYSLLQTNLLHRSYTFPVPLPDIFPQTYQRTYGFYILRISLQSGTAFYF